MRYINGFKNIISKNVKIKLLLLFIVIVAFLLRIQTAKYDLLLLADPWYHYAMIKFIVNNGYYIPFNNLSNHPFYGISPNPPGLYWIPAILYWLVSKVYSIKLLRFVQIIPSIIGSLTVIPIYLIGKELKNKYLGITMAFVFAVSPIIVKSGLAGYYRGEFWMIFFGMFSVYYFLRYLNSLNLKYIFYSSVFTVLCSLVWNGWVYIPVIIGIIHFVYVIYYKKDSFIKGFIIYMIFSSIFVGIWKIIFFYHYLNHLLVFLILLGICLFEIIYLKYIKIKNVNVYLGIFLLFWLILIVGLRMLDIDLVSKIISLILTGKISKGPRIILTENYFSYWDLLLGFSVYIFLILVFIFKFIKDLIKNSITFEYLLAFALLVSSIMLSLKGIRFIFVSSLGYIIPIGLIFSEFLENLIKRIINFKNYSTLFLKLKTIFSIFIFLILISVPIISSENQISKITPYISKDWYKASLWMKNKDGKTIFTFWDQANWFIAISEKTVFTDTQTNFGNNPYKDAYVFCANYSTGIERLKKLRANYVAVDKRTLLMWYWLQPFNMNKNVKFNESFLYHLYYENVSSKDLKLVFKSDDLKIYKVIYHKPVIYNVLCNNSKITIYSYSPYLSKINATLKICKFNTTKVVFKKNFSFKCYGDCKKSIDVNLSNGIYDVYVSDGEVIIKKVLVVR
ncbi:STT3 domain-containing protein [Methanocaldococcus sp.]